MRRREFIAGFGTVAAIWPLALNAQQVPAQVRRVGVLMNNSTNDADAVSREAMFAKSLETLGWKQGKNLLLDVRWSEGNRGLMNQHATDLVSHRPDALLAASTSNLSALIGQTRTIPIVFVQVSDPVAQGFVKDLTRPGGNITARRSSGALQVSSVPKQMSWITGLRDRRSRDGGASQSPCSSWTVEPHQGIALHSQGRNGRNNLNFN
jgi:ABC-type uncharacterized transport system substrate-binding protein